MGSSIFFFDATLLATANWAGERHLSPPGQSKPSLVFFKFVISFGKLESYQQLWIRSQKVERDTSWKDQIIFSPWFQRSLRPSYILIIGLCELIFFGLSWVSVNHILLLTIRQKKKNQPETIQSALRKALYPWIQLNLDQKYSEKKFQKVLKSKTWNCRKVATIYLHSINIVFKTIYWYIIVLGIIEMI